MLWVSTAAMLRKCQNAYYFAVIFWVIYNRLGWGGDCLPVDNDLLCTFFGEVFASKWLLYVYDTFLLLNPRKKKRLNNEKLELKDDNLEI